MSVRLKFLVVSLLLCVALASVVFAAVNTVQAYQNFTQDHQRVEHGDISTVDSWMTLPYIARVYHVPVNCLAQSLRITSPFLKQHANLRVIANYKRRSVNAVLDDVRQEIQRYRAHPTCPASTPGVPIFQVFLHPPAEYERSRYYE